MVFGALWLFDGGSDSASPDSTAALATRRRDVHPVPGTRKLVDADGNVLATAVVLPDGTGYLTSELPALPAGRTYQLWGVDNRNTISLGVMGRNPRCRRVPGRRASAGDRGHRGARGRRAR